MDPSAANYNPSATSDDGTCTFVVPEAAAEEELSGDLHTFITSALSSLWGAQQAHAACMHGVSQMLCWSGMLSLLWIFFSTSQRALAAARREQL